MAVMFWQPRQPRALSEAISTASQSAIGGSLGCWPWIEIEAMCDEAGGALPQMLPLPPFHASQDTVTTC